MEIHLNAEQRTSSARPHEQSTGIVCTGKIEDFARVLLQNGHVIFVFVFLGYFQPLTTEATDINSAPDHPNDRHQIRVRIADLQENQR